MRGLTKTFPMRTTETIRYRAICRSLGTSSTGQPTKHRAGRTKLLLTPNVVACWCFIVAAYSLALFWILVDTQDIPASAEGFISEYPTVKLMSPLLITLTLEHLIPFTIHQQYDKLFYCTNLFMTDPTEPYQTAGD